MDQNTENKTDFKDKIINFYYLNKIKLIIFTIIIFLSMTSIAFLKNYYVKKNIFIAEKYIEAGLYLVSDNKEKAREVYDEIILSKNKFYSVLALNNILEKELVSDRAKIDEYFDILEKMNLSKDNTELVNLKKALYLIKNGHFERGNELLEKLIKNNSKLKPLITEILEK